MSRNTITINGVTISTDGDSVSISNGRIMVDGKNVTPSDKIVSILVQGDLTSISADVCEKIVVTGSAGSVDTQSGDVECGPVTGGVKTMSGDVRCGDVGGSIGTMSGDVTCAKAHGSISTMSGDVRR